MLGDEDNVFDSVTWESPATQAYDAGPSIPSGPGFRQSTSESDSGQGPNDPKWEGYLITAVKDPVKELAETKDTYVSYLVTAKVLNVPLFLCVVPCSFVVIRPTCPYSRPPTLHLADDSLTSSSCVNTSLRTSRHASSRLYLINIDWVRPS